MTNQPLPSTLLSAHLSNEWVSALIDSGVPVLSSTASKMGLARCERARNLLLGQLCSDVGMRNNKKHTASPH